MALLINNSKFKNTEVVAPQMYARLQYFALADGKKVNATLIVSDNKVNALAWKEISTNIPQNVLVILSESENQDLATIHNAVKAQLESQGFEVTVQL